MCRLVPTIRCAVFLAASVSRVTIDVWPRRLSRDAHVHVWHEQEHPREEGGQFTEGSGGGAAAVSPSGKPLPANVKKVGEAYVTQTQNPDHPWAAARYIEKLDKWQPDIAGGSGQTPEEAAGAKSARTEAEGVKRQSQTEARGAYEQAIEQAKGGFLTPNGARALSRFNNENVSQADAVAILRAMGLPAGKAAAVVKSYNTSKQSSGGAWLYPTMEVVRRGQNALGIKMREVTPRRAQAGDARCRCG